MQKQNSRRSPWQSWGDYKQESSLHFGKEKDPKTGEWKVVSNPTDNIVNFGDYTSNLNSKEAIEMLLYRIYSGTYMWQIENTTWIKLIFVLIILLIVGLGVYIYWKETEQKKESELIKKELELIKKELDKKLNNFGI
jgi:hypothetical protein